MKRVLTFVCVVCVFVGAMRTLAFGADAAPEREIAITIDDLPAGAANVMSAVEITQMTTKLLATLREQKVPAVGFVNERKLYFKWGEVDERIKALNMWLDSGFELGNHTYGHTSLNRAGLKDFEDAVIQGENVTRLLQTQHHMTMRYFRHPYLDTGRDMQTRREAEAFLTARGYRVAPVTMDAWDWMFAGVYDDAKRRGDTALQQPGSGAYRRAAGVAAEARVQVHHAGRRTERPSVRLAGYLRRRRGNQLARSLGDHHGQAAAARSRGAEGHGRPGECAAAPAAVG